jgi:hypothetical protein
MALRCHLSAALAALALAQPLGAAAVEEEGAVSLRFDLTPGHTWTERTQSRDRELIEDPRVEESRTERGMHLALEYCVLPPEHVIPPAREELSRVEVTVIEAASFPVLDGQPLSQFDLGEADPMASTVGVSIVDRVDIHGQVIPGEEWSGAVPGGVDTLLRVALFSVRCDLPDHPVRVGEVWLREVEHPTNPDIRMAIQSTLRGIEEREGQRVAIIDRRLDLSAMGPFEESPSQEGGYRSEVSLYRLERLLSGESHLLIDEGLWLRHRIHDERTETHRVRVNQGVSRTFEIPTESYTERSTVSEIEIEVEHTLSSCSAVHPP